jgi:hypothetical protein
MQVAVRFVEAQVPLKAADNAKFLRARSHKVKEGREERVQADHA